jgi:Domain of unknown function (DUF6457)
MYSNRAKSGTHGGMEDNRMTAQEWVRTFAEAAGAKPPTEDEIDEILRLAAVAAHSSERIAAPIACWIAGTTGRPISELRELGETISTES